MNDMINKLIIVAGQWKQFQDKKYERQFGRLLNELAWIAETDLDGALQLLLKEIEDDKLAA